MSNFLLVLLNVFACIAWAIGAVLNYQNDEKRLCITNVIASILFGSIAICYMLR